MAGGRGAARKNLESMVDDQTYWDGMVEIDVSAADYDVVTTLGSDVWVRGIEASDVSGGKLIKIDHRDMLNSGARTNVSQYVAGAGVPKWPLPPITKVYNAGTTAAGIVLYYQRKR